MNLNQARVARLATCGQDLQPHCVPVCFLASDRDIVIALDEKPKRVAPGQLRRVRNIRENPRVALLVDHYEEDWTRLSFAMIEGNARLDRLTQAETEGLRDKYPQYREMELSECLRIEPERIVRWPC
ncbi:MAG: TIGR03668 family PPOX class F420-dependent oxidoreductase [Armatimonadetes bacterium]|nr:TIGR03668 family PPOX class F420-dependent oxidoreductase [Armatimonadota bacterium]